MHLSSDSQIKQILYVGDSCFFSAVLRWMEEILTHNIVISGLGKRLYEVVQDLLEV